MEPKKDTAILISCASMPRFVDVFSTVIDVHCLKTTGNIRFSRGKL